ncbi:hypothetical protein Tco_0487276 [Tanacetum coccineum]
MIKLFRTISFLGLPEDIYVAVDSCETAQEIGQMRMVGANGGNQFTTVMLAECGYLNEYNAVQIVRELEVGSFLLGNCTDRPRWKGCCLSSDSVVIAQRERSGNPTPSGRSLILMAAQPDIDEIEEVNANCILMANLQQASDMGGYSD